MKSETVSNNPCIGCELHIFCRYANTAPVVRYNKDAFEVTCTCKIKDEYSIKKKEKRFNT